MYDEPQWQYSVAGRTLTSATIGVLQDHVCLETPQGWMLALHPYTLRAFLWRPDDGERIALPDMTESFPMNCKCVLSDKPGGGGFCAVMVFELNKSKFEYWLCAVSGSKWERHGYELTMYNAEDQPVVRHMARRNGMAAVGGKVYVGENLVPKGAPTPQSSSPSKGQEPKSPFGGLHLLSLLLLSPLLPLLLLQLALLLLLLRSRK
jgi:hypothetical protein